MSATSESAFACRDLTVTVPGRTLVADLQMHVESGEFIAVLGQNGAGKSLTLLTLAGLRRFDQGEVLLLGETLTSKRRQDIAKNLALLPQYTEDPVTGAAHCVLTPYWSARLGKIQLTARQISHRGGELGCELRNDRVLLRGHASFYLEGKLTV